MIYLLSEKEYLKISIAAGLKKHWYGYVRGWTDGKDIYINIDAFYINERDRILLCKHELMHTQGFTHTVFGVMSPWGLVRWLTS